jgi:uncharacterized damage-inducible protein DinB
MTQNSLINASKAIFKDGYFYLSKISPEAYQQPLDLYSGSSLGQHTRHWIEFFQCLIDQSMTDGLLCYDKRKRDLALETIPDKAIDALHAMEQSMNKLPSLGKIILTSEMSDGTEVQLSTSLGRELWFVIEHAVHHLALIKIGLKALYPDWQLPEHFGMATSTMNHQSKSLVAK